MTSLAVLPGAGAVPRMVRGAAGRRPVRVALLVGGLFALGLLCGTRASAADGAPTSSPLPTSVTAAVTVAVTDVTGTVSHAPPPVDDHAVAPVASHVAERDTERLVRPDTDRIAPPVTGRSARPVTEDVVQPVAEHVVRPVGGGVMQPVVEDVVQPVAGPVLRPVTEDVVVPVGDLVESVTEGLAGVSSHLPPVGGMPSLPGVPESPELPGWTTLPVKTRPVDVTSGEPGRAGAKRPGSAVDGDSGSDGERASGPASVVYGPASVVGGAVVVSAPHPDAAVGDAPVVRVPAQQNPDGLPTGSLGRHSAVDNGGPRHAEPQTVAALDPAPPSLVPCAPVTDAPDGTRDRHRDIPESPG